MPIYEFICNNCGKNSEHLCSVQWEGKVTCPHCSSPDLRKLISLVSSAGSSCGGDCCSGCSGKSCSTCK